VRTVMIGRNEMKCAHVPTGYQQSVVLLVAFADDSRATMRNSRSGFVTRLPGCKMDGLSVSLTASGESLWELSTTSPV
jgi:hypothetical protein